MIHPASVLLLLAGACSLAACNNPDTVLFVTNTSLGINFDSKPATASVAYDRVEGFIGPRYENGGVPPAVGSLQTDGNIFNPTIRQTYATGSAAVGVTSGTVKEPTEGLEGRSDQKKLMYFGTSTTFGLKVGFAATGSAPVPDSFLFGYRRKEASIIPLAERPAPPTPNRPEGTMTAVYPPVLATVEVNVSSSPTDPQGVGTNSTQFFATGTAAENLSTNGRVRAAFQYRAEKAALSGLTPEEVKAADALAAKELKSHNDRLNAVIDFLTKEGSFKTRLGTLVNKAGVNPKIKNAASPDELKKTIGRSPVVVEALYNATLG